MKKFLPLSLVIISIGFGVWLMAGNREATVSKSFFSMGTFFEITAVGPKPDQAIAEAFEEIKGIEVLTSIQKKTGLSKLNQAAGIKPVKVDPVLIAILKKTAELYPDLAGSFDPTVGPIIDLWGFGPEGSPNLPNPEEINKALALVGFRRVVINEAKGNVFLPVKGMKLDLGGIAKGYAIDQAYLSLKRAGIRSALINGGSSSIRTIGKRDNQKPWRLGIGHPRRNGELLGVLELPGDRSLATSADTQNFFISNGKRYSHLINPRTGYPATDKILVTVTAPTAIEADLLSTAFFVMPVAAIKVFLADNPEYGAIIYDSSEQLIILGEETFQATR